MNVAYADSLPITSPIGRYPDPDPVPAKTRKVFPNSQSQTANSPKKPPEFFPGYTVAGNSQSAQWAGGGFYDVIQANGEGVLLAIADAVGESAPAALGAARYLKHLLASRNLFHTPASLLARLNHLLCLANQDGVEFLITAQLAYFDTASHSLTIGSAGHHSALLAEGNAGTVREINGDGPPLGITRHALFSDERIQLERPFHLLMLGEGLIGSHDPAGPSRAHEAIAKTFQSAAASGADAPALGHALRQLGPRRRSGGHSPDDITFVALAQNHGG